MSDDIDWEQIYRSNMQALREESGQTLDQDKCDAFFEMHHEGTSTIVLTAMLSLAIREGVEPYDYWLEYNEERFIRLANFVVIALEHPEAPADEPAWEEVTIHGRPFSKLVQPVLH